MEQRRTEPRPDEKKRPGAEPAPSGPKQKQAEPASPQTPDERVDEASEESFPASDPPTWTSQTGVLSDEKDGANPPA